MAGEILGGIVGGLNNILEPIETLFGSTTIGKTKGRATSESTAEATKSRENRDRLDISDEAINKIVNDILTGPDGLASIFAGEQNAGIFDSSVAAQTAGDLTAKITGEIAKLRAERIQTENSKQVETQSTVQTQDTSTEQGKRGLIDQIFG